MKDKNRKQNPKNTNEQKLFVETRNGNIRNSGKPRTSKAEEGYCNEMTQRRPLSHSQGHHAQHISKHTEVKQRMAWTKEETRQVIWCYMYCKQYFTANYKKVYEIWRQRNPECRTYMDAKKLMNQRNYIMKNKKITELEIEEIKKELKGSQRSHLNEREGEEQSQQLYTINEEEKKQNLEPATVVEMEIHQQRSAICKLKEKIESTYNQVTQIEIDKRPRMQKLQNVFEVKEIMKTANEAMTEVLAGKDLNMTELNHLIYAAATALTEEIIGTGSYKSETWRPETPPWVRQIQDSINGIRKELSALAEIKRNDRNTHNTKREKLPRKYKIETKENFDQVTEELKQKVSAKTQ
jgi:hypothetical protein